MAATRDEYLAREAVYRDDELLIGGLEIMQDWERPLMKAIAQEAASTKGHVLEVGFGMGISAGYIVDAGASEYTIIEPHPGVLKRIREDWAPKQPIDVHIAEGFWEDVLPGLGQFDGILFDTYPIAEGEGGETGQQMLRAFIPEAAKHLRPGGVFSFYGSHPDELPAEDIELIKQHFSAYDSYVLTGLKPPKNQYYNYERMVVPRCTK